MSVSILCWNYECFKNRLYFSIVVWILLLCCENISSFKSIAEINSSCAQLLFFLITFFFQLSFRGFFFSTVFDTPKEFGRTKNKNFGSSEVIITIQAHIKVRLTLDLNRFEGFLMDGAITTASTVRNCRNTSITSITILKKAPEIYAFVDSHTPLLPLPACF